MQPSDWQWAWPFARTCWRLERTLGKYHDPFRLSRPMGVLGVLSRSGRITGNPSVEKFRLATREPTSVLLTSRVVSQIEMPRATTSAGSASTRHKPGVFRLL